MFRFAKMHGLGNDFVIAEGIYQQSAEQFLTADRLRQWANRQTGIGFDQLLFLTASDTAGVDFRYRIFNADGGEVGQCGNGVRCAHYFLQKQRFTTKSKLVFETITTRMTTTKVSEHCFRVDLPPPQFAPDFTCEEFTFHSLSVGNPHAVCFSETMTDAQLNRIGKQLNASGEGMNVGCGTIASNGKADEINLRVYERGVGMTQSCGSGCLAAAVTAIRQERVKNPVAVQMPGGKVVCGLASDESDDIADCWLEGEVALVFYGGIATD